MSLGDSNEPEWLRILRFFCYGAQPYGYPLDVVDNIIRAEARRCGTAWPARRDALLNAIAVALAAEGDVSQALWMTAPDALAREFLQVLQSRLNATR